MSRRPYKAWVPLGSRRSNRFGNYDQTPGEIDGLPRATVEEAIVSAKCMARPGTPAMVRNEEGVDIVLVNTSGKCKWIRKEFKGK